MPTNNISLNPIRLSSFFAIAFLVVTSSGCLLNFDRVLRPQPPPQTQQQPKPIKEVVPPDDPAVQSFSDNVSRLIKQRDYQKLEEFGANLVKSKERFKGGGWKIFCYDLHVASPAGEHVDDAAWQSHIAFLEEWTEKIPDSILARTALANAYIDYAWDARGEGWASSVSEENWAKFKERIEKAAAVAEEASRLDRRYTGYFELLLLLGKAQGWDRKSFDSVFDEAVAFEPRYEYFYVRKAENLLPRWNGQPGEWEAFADKTKADLGEKEGLETYYLIVSIMSRYFGGEFFDQNRVSWGDTKKGFELWEKEFGMSRYRLNQFGLLAVTATDPPTACSIFTRLQGENDFEPDVWADRKMFEGYRQIGLQFCKTPYINNATPRP